MARRLEVLLSLAAAVACAAPALPQASPRAVEHEIVWPRPPAAPRVRRVGSATLAHAPRASWWRTALRWIAGASPKEAGEDDLVRPFDVAVRADGSFVVADPDRPGVLEYARDGTFAASLACSDHPWGSPMSVALGRDGAVWVADAAAGAVVRWTAQGCRVLRPEGVERPTGLAILGDRIAVADPPVHRVVLLSQEGALLASWGAGEADAFNFPSDVAAGPDGSLFVVDALNFRIVRLAADGRRLGAFGSRGDSGADLARPKGVHVDAAGRVYVTDAHRDVVLVFRPDGGLEYRLGEPGPGPGQLAHPAGLSVSGDRLVVADSVNRRAEIFELLGESR